jgi:hypothetical protein
LKDSGIGYYSENIDLLYKDSSVKRIKEAEEKRDLKVSDSNPRFRK